ncbi:TonB-dependent receptor [Mucilaginibacter segetis]|uniref:TonB-dependent receptor n=1 Tax=Mucilaginibacter segetis TaxID=2793071 RepID=A0A934UMT8_9SPHI|nr:TonB-dependent receptor [Mucilaginibacter segetis]MBK0379719.1 TonB-dependent receptor [Mucilaginibacter segetis]
MKLTVVLWITALLQVGAATYAQKVSLSVKNVPLDLVLDKLGKQTGYNFLYNSTTIKKGVPVSLNVKDETLTDVLMQCFKYQPFTYIINGNTVVIREKDNTAETSSNIVVAPIVISGLITDARGVPLPGVNVREKGTTNGVTSDPNGRYSITVDNANAVLVFSFIGFTTQELAVGERTQINVTLKEQVSNLEDVVVIGYGSVKKRDLTGAVGQLKGEDLMKGNPISLSQGLQGKLAGVSVNQNDGAPGAGVSIQIRGANSYGTNTQPLYVIDGIPFDAASTPTNDATSGNNQTFNPLALINPSDIESVEILKDASATAIYGSRGANGVVLVTTKKGKAGETKVQFSTNTSVSMLGKRVEVLDPYNYSNYVNEGYNNGVLYNGYTFYQLPYPGQWSYPYANNQFQYDAGVYQPAPEDFLKPGIRTDEYGNSTDVEGSNWLDLITRTAISQDYNLSVSGGGDHGFYSISGNYAKQEGIIKRTDFERYALRANVGQKVGNWLEIGLNTSFGRTVSNFAKTNSFDYGIIRSALIFPTTFAPQTDITQISNELGWLSANPYLYVMTAKDNLAAISSFSSAYGEVKLTDWLKFRQNLGINYSANNRGTYYNSLTGEGQAPTINGRAGQSDDWYTRIVTESLLTFNKDFGRIHSLNAVLGFTHESANYGNKAMSATNFPDDLTYDYDMGKALNPGKLVSGRGASELVSFLARANYTLNDKYLFTASFRRDGSSKFATKNKFANFVSGAIAWRASEEKFIKNLNVFSDLKFRLSAGKTGNQAIAEYATLPQLASANYPIGGSLQSGMAESTYNGPANPNLKWETTTQYDAGVDMGFLNNRISFVIDYYSKKTTDLLQSIKTPLSTGFQQMTINHGWVKNEGLEITGKFQALVTGPLKWSIDANISFNRNTIGGLDNDQFASRLWNAADYVFIQRNGMPIGAIYGYVEDGYYDNEAEVRSNPVYANASDAIIKQKIGEVKYLNLDDDPNITDADRTIIGNTNPDFIAGITNNFNYKNFNLSFFIQGVYGNDIFNGNLSDVTLNSIGNIPAFAYAGRWTPDTKATATWPKVNNGYTREWLISNRYIEDGSYVRLKSVTFGYDFNKPFKGVQTISLFATGTNLLTLTKYDWFDPDVNSFGGDASRRGVDIHAYPSSRTFSLGARVSF